MDARIGIRLTLPTLLTAMLALCLVLVLPAGMGAQQTAGEADGTEETELPGLAELIPMASELYGKLTALQNIISQLPDLSGLASGYSAVESDLEYPAGRLQSFRVADRYRYHNLLEIREDVRYASKRFEETSGPLYRAISRLEKHRSEWLAEKEMWVNWRSAMDGYAGLEQISLVFDRVDSTIESALSLIDSRLGPMLDSQKSAGEIEEKIYALQTEIDALMESRRRNVMIQSTPHVFSPDFAAQFDLDIWNALADGFDEAALPGRRFFRRHGWIGLMQILLSLILIGMLLRKRQGMKGSDRWHFIARRPLSAGIFFVSISSVLAYQYSGAPLPIQLVNMIVAALTFVRLVSALTDKKWQIRAATFFMALMIMLRTMVILGLPLPLFRIFIILTAACGSLLCFRWAAQSRKDNEKALYSFLLRLSALYFAFISVAETWGAGTLPLYLISSFVRTVATLLVFMLFLYMINGWLEWLFRKRSIGQTAILKGVDTDSVIRRTMNFVDVVVCGLILMPGILMIWGVFGDLGEATGELLSLGFTIGTRRISFKLLIVAAGILYGAFFISWILQKSLMDGMFAKFKTERGVRHAIARLLHYLIMFIGFLIVISVLGVDITKLTIVISALGVGIGFGLQGIVNNFVSGLILLFERPVRVGDLIEVGGKWARIRQIGIRSTRVYTFDQADLIIPNADLISNNVTNWTLSDRQVRLIIPVGVEYGSEVELVMEGLLACAADNPKVAKSVPPKVLFTGFGDSSLEFELWVWVMDADYRMAVKSELNQAIDREFREAGITIAFPQLDLHLRSLAEGAVQHDNDSQHRQ